MPVFENKVLQTFIDELLVKYESEVNLSPRLVQIDVPVTDQDYAQLLLFLTEKRKQFFVFTLNGEPERNLELEFTARRAVLEQYANDQLKAPIIRKNPLKLAIKQKQPISASIQIQKSYQPSRVKPRTRAYTSPVRSTHSLVQQTQLQFLSLTEAFGSSKYQKLYEQLSALGVTQIQDRAVEKITKHFYAFTDGLIPENLPIGFYIDTSKSLCFTDSPHKFPNALAPSLLQEDKQALAYFPSCEEAQKLLKDIQPSIITDLYATDSDIQKNTLLKVLSPSYTKELQKFFHKPLSSTEETFLIPFLVKLFILGGDTQVLLMTQLIEACRSKNIAIDFLKDPLTQNSFFFCPQGIKNLHKLLNLPEDKYRVWWNTLSAAHLAHEDHQFDFNGFLAAYTQEFIPYIIEHKLPLPTTCPIHHPGGHFLTTLNRLVDVIEHAADPAEQCMHLEQLDWGPTGVHYAKKHATKTFQHVSACMELQKASDTETSPEEMYAQISQINPLQLQTWAWRYIGQHWKTKIHFSTLQTLFQTIQNSSLSLIQKNELTFIFTCTYAEKSTPSSEELTSTLTKCIHYLEQLSDESRIQLMTALSRCHLFKPAPSLIQIQMFIEHYLELQTLSPTKHTDFLGNFFPCLEQEGYLPFHRIQLSFQKTTASHPQQPKMLNSITAFASMVNRKRDEIKVTVGDHYPSFINLLTALNEQAWPRSIVDNLLESIRHLTQKNPPLTIALLSLLGQFNITKSRVLPTSIQVCDLIRHFYTTADQAPTEEEALSSWIRAQMIDGTLLQGCTFGEGDISDPGDLIVNGLVDIAKLRAGLLNKIQTIDVCDVVRYPLDAINTPLDKIVVQTKFEHIRPRTLFKKIDALSKTHSTVILYNDVLYYVNPMNHTIEPIHINPAHQPQFQELQKTAIAVNQPQLATDEQRRLITLLTYVTDFKEGVIEKLNHPFVPEELKKKIEPDLFPVLDAMTDLINFLQTDDPNFDDLIDCLHTFEMKKTALVNAEYKLAFGISITGENLLSFLLTGERKKDKITKKVSDNHTYGPLTNGLEQFYKENTNKIKAFFSNPSNNTIIKELTPLSIFAWFEAFNDTHSLLFLVKDELIQSKIVPSLKKILTQLDTGDADFDREILETAGYLPDEGSSDLLLTQYKDNIQGIADYLKLLIKLKSEHPEAFFYNTFQQMNKGTLNRLNSQQKAKLLASILKVRPALLTDILSDTVNVLDAYPQLEDSATIQRAIEDACRVLDINNLNEAQQREFFKLSLNHSLQTTSPFPLSELLKLQELDLAPEVRGVLMSQLMAMLSHSRAESSLVIAKTTAFLQKNPKKAPLCLSLLVHLAQTPSTESSESYIKMLTGLEKNPEYANSLAHILTCLANNKQDHSVNLPTLEEIATNLINRIKQVDLVREKLFVSPPYPSAATLNDLLVPSDDRLERYCHDYDFNPFGKPNETRPLEKHFSMARVKECLLNLKNLATNLPISHELQLKLARQLTYIETLGYTDPLNPSEGSTNNLTLTSRETLRQKASYYLQQLRENLVPTELREHTQLILLAYLREIYFRTTGFFPYTTQMLTLLLSINIPSNLLMQVKTGEGKSVITPILALLQWVNGGNIDICTASRTLLDRDYEKNYEAFFDFFRTPEDKKLVPSTRIYANSAPSTYLLDGINCSTLEDKALFDLATDLAAKESQEAASIQNADPTHLILDECDDALLDQPTLYKLVLNPSTKKEASIAWIYKAAYHFVHTNFVNKDAEPDWDEEEDVEQFRIYLTKKINEKFKGDPQKLTFLMSTTNNQLRQWIDATFQAARLVEDKHFVIQQHTHDDSSSVKMVCVPLSRSVPKPGCIFTDCVQQALQARMSVEQKNVNFIIEEDAPILASQSAHSFIKNYLNTGGRLIGVSGTPGDPIELQTLKTLFGTHAYGIPSHAEDNRQDLAPVFTFSTDETVKAVRHAIDKIKRPFSPIHRTLNPDIFHKTHLHTVRMQHILESKAEINTWYKTQTQPILVITEDFTEAKNLAAHLEGYKNQGLTIQVVTGKESPSDLEKIIQQAGQANTITVGTAMLARGIDVDSNDHPLGLFVIQTYTESERMTRQIAGRTARNGKPGTWLPIYKVAPPQSALKKLLYIVIGFFKPSYRARINQQAVNNMQAQMKLKANAERLYSQAIHHIQETLMLQIEAWESLLLEIDPEYKALLYDWRATLLSELNKFQSTQLSSDTVDSNIAQYKASICKLWKNHKEEKWAAKVSKITHLLPHQQLMFEYLNKLDFEQELNVQKGLHQSHPFLVGSDLLAKQNLEVTILNKAGAALHYIESHVAPSTVHALKLAQNKQLLPHLIGQLCAVYPPAIEAYKPKETKSQSFFGRVFNQIITRKNKIFNNDESAVMIQALLEHYQKELLNADEEAIHTILKEMRSLILAFNRQLSNASIVERFKAQGLFLTFTKLYEESGLAQKERDALIAQINNKSSERGSSTTFEQNASLDFLRLDNENAIMKQLAEYLTRNLAWAVDPSLPLHARLDREVAKQAASELHKQAALVIEKPENDEQIKDLYKLLLKHHFQLKNKTLLPFRHTNLKTVITTALSAIDSLTYTPKSCCDKAFREASHDEALINHYREKFSRFFQATTPILYKQSDKLLWAELKRELSIIADQSSGAELFTELHQAIERFLTPTKAAPIKRACATLQKKLTHMTQALVKKTPLKDASLHSFLEQKTSQFAELLHLKKEQVHIRQGYNGIASYIEMHIESADRQTSFTGYESRSISKLREEQDKLKQRLKIFTNSDPDQLRQLLSTSQDMEMSAIYRQCLQEIEKLAQLKACLAQPWQADILIPGISKAIQKQLDVFNQLKHADCVYSRIESVSLLAELNDRPQFQAINGRLAQWKILEQQLLTLQEKTDTNQPLLAKPKEELAKAEGDRKELIKNKDDAWLFELRLDKLNKKIEERKDILLRLEEPAREAENKRASIVTLRQELATLYMEVLQDTIQESMQQILTPIEASCRATEQTLKIIEAREITKSKYQTRRFFGGVRELSDYAAELRNKDRATLTI